MWGRACQWVGCDIIVHGERPYCEEHQKKIWKAKQATDRDGNERERKFYRSQEWVTLSRVMRAREPYCRECMRYGTETFATCVDHIIPLKMAWHLRLSPKNLQPLCDSCHAKKRAREANAYVNWDSAKACTIVCGPPGSGKSTYVKQRMKHGDLVLDLDYLEAAISFQPTHQKQIHLLQYAIAARDGVYAQLVLAGADRPRSWIITTGGSSKQRRVLQNMFVNSKVIVLAVGAQECISRLASDRKREHQLSAMKSVIADWWYDFQPDPERETILKTRMEVADSWE